jgi:hypothetical protein
MMGCFEKPSPHYTPEEVTILPFRLGQNALEYAYDRIKAISAMPKQCTANLIQTYKKYLNLLTTAKP